MQQPLHLCCTASLRSNKLQYDSQMSEAKHKRSTAKLPNKTVKAPPPQSATKLKPRPQFTNNKPPQQQTVTRNLLPDFKTPSEPRMETEQDKSIEYLPFQSQTPMQSEYHSNDSQVSSQTAQSAIRETATRQKQNQYGFELPKSYILALNGLQEGIKARDSEIRKLKKYVKEQGSLNQNCQNEISEAHERQTQLQTKISQLAIDMKFLRETLTDAKSQNTKIMKQKILVENDLQNLKQSFGKQSVELEKELQIKTNALKDYQSLIAQLKQAMKSKDCELDNRKRQISQVLLKSGEDRAKHKSQIQALKQQIIALTDRVVLQGMKQKEEAILNEKDRLDVLEAEIVVNRSILKEITAEDNTEPRPRSQTCLKQTYNNEQSVAKNVPRLPISSSKMHQRPSMSGMERSSNRARMYRQPPTTTDRNKNLISQYRELMRHQKQLISFNYQMQQLEKGMLSEKDDGRRDQIQRNYSRLKRQIEKKQMVVNELKSFLNDPTGRGTN